MSQGVNLPKGWIEAKFGELFVLPGDEIVDGPFGSNLKASEYVSSGIPIARLQNVDRNRFVAKNIQFVTSEKAKALERHTFKPNDILITKLGDPLGKACLVPHTVSQGVLVADVVRARITHPWINERFLCYQINSAAVIEQFKDQTKGTTRPRVNLSKIRAVKLRLCPVGEQTRIVVKLEELLSDLDAGVAELKAAQKKLAQYRQSLLKAAVEGALTAEWRATHPPTETGAQLLARILTERRARWEARQLAKFAEQGKTPPKDWQKKYPEPVQPDTGGLPELPQGWVWASLDQLVAESCYGTSVKCSYESGGTPVIRIPNVSGGSLDLQDMKFATSDLALGKDDHLSVGDLLVIRTNGSISLVGRAAAVVVELEIPHYFASYLLRLRSVETTCVHRWMLTTLSAHTGRQWLEARAASSAGQHNISLSTLLTMPVPLPSLLEEQAILQELDAGFRFVKGQGEALDHSLNQSTAQRQNILRAAFSGQLVPQDPSDEPASMLLERIRTERAAQAAAKKPRGRKSRETA
ncbi:MAG: restriction endonuclease [Rhodoferax sp.]|nr:restriction endonuclease [Rhodoferax sp.]MCB2027743.1 restriction endonuclease [Rhodoferax sp.]MCB2040729.1 restriction endonuclease [Rhodoferax sp.]MCW5627376.1 restriction endonuclease [Rhodoferax sp.]